MVSYRFQVFITVGIHLLSFADINQINNLFSLINEYTFNYVWNNNYFLDKVYLASWKHMSLLHWQISLQDELTK